MQKQIPNSQRRHPSKPPSVLREAIKPACNNNDTGADSFLNPLSSALQAAAQSTEAWMNAGGEALLIGNPLKKSGQLLTLARRQRCEE
jgi:hypothetical protein